MIVLRVDQDLFIVWKIFMVLDALVDTLTYDIDLVKPDENHPDAEVWEGVMKRPLPLQNLPYYENGPSANLYCLSLLGLHPTRVCPPNFNCDKW